MPIRIPSGPPEPGPTNLNGPSLFARPSATSARTLEAFRQLKPVCVPIMGMHAMTATTYAQDLQSLSKLRITLHSLPEDSLDDAFTPSLINYAIFPLTNLLQRFNPLDIRGRLLEEIFTSLAFLVQRWKRAEGVPTKTWEQLWILVAIILGGPPSSKGKRKELDDELKMAAVQLLKALLEPQEEEIGGPPAHPSVEMMAVLYSSKSLTPMLFHTTSALLDLLPSSERMSLQISALSLLRLLVSTYLKGKNEMLASVLPGVMSTLVKVVTTKDALLNSSVAAEICGLAGEALTCTVNDADMLRKGVLKPRVTNLSQFAEGIATDGQHMAQAIAKPPDKGKDQFPRLTHQYLEFTQTQVMAAFGSLVPGLQKHSSSTTRSALVDMLQQVLRHCCRSLPSLREPLLSSLLYLAKDDFDDVHAYAMVVLSELLRDEAAGRDCYNAVRVILERSISAFPQQVMSKNDPRILETTKIISSVASLVIDMGSGPSNPIRQLLGPDGGIQRWGFSLLRCLELGREVGIDESRPAAQRAWQLAQGMVEWRARPLLEANPARPEEMPYPEARMIYIESKQTLHAVAAMFEDLGSAAGDDALFAVDFFTQLAQNRHGGPDAALAATALWLVGRLLHGLARQADPSIMVRKAAYDVMDVIISLDEDDCGENIEEASPAEHDELVPVEQSRGIDNVALLLNKTSARTPKEEQEKTRRLRTRQHRHLTQAFSLSIMAECANILGVAFRPLLLRCLYIVLSHLGSPSAFLEQYAGTALTRLAYHAGYASPQNLVMDNVDYVINVVSQRMTYRRLDVLAPMVLISMIRLVGSPIVPLVQDVVDDIFDVLDDFHGYNLLASTFFAVLDSLIQAMAVDLPIWQPKAATSTLIQTLPDPRQDFAQLGEWYRDRAVRARTAVEEYLAKAPQKPWREDDEDEDKNPQDPPAGTKDEPEVPLTRSQEVCKRILDKSIYYMTHESPFIRTRVLSVFTAGIAVLVERESDLLPLVNRAWPYILKRLDDEEPYVVTEAARVVEALAHYTGDFMSRRILDHAWPAMKRLVDTQSKLDSRSALVRQGQAADSAFTVSHRLYSTIMDALFYIIQEVPVNDALLWDMTTTFLPFLDSTSDERLQHSAVKLYQQMARRDEDAVWLALHAVAGNIGGGQQTHLRQPGLDIQHNAELIFQ